MPDHEPAAAPSTWTWSRSTSPPGTARCWPLGRLVAGYVPGVDILTGCDLELDAGRAGGHHRPQRCRQVDPAQGHVRPGAGDAPGPSSSGVRTSPRPRPTGWWPSAWATCPRTTTSSRASPSRRTWRWASTSGRRDFGARFDEVCDLFPLLGERRKQRAGSLSGGERQMVAMGRALMMRPVGAAARRALRRAVARLPGRGVHPMPADQRDRRVDRDGGAERSSLPADLPRGPSCSTRVATPTRAPARSSCTTRR